MPVDMKTLEQLLARRVVTLNTEGKNEVIVNPNMEIGIKTQGQIDGLKNIGYTVKR
jgi:hypothetical protein